MTPRWPRSLQEQASVIMTDDQSWHAELISLSFFPGLPPLIKPNYQIYRPLMSF